MFGHTTPASTTRSAQLGGRIQGSGRVEGVRYPSPFFDLAHTYLPTSVKQMFQWCRYFYLTNPLIATVVNKMAEYPVTDIIIDSDNKGLKEKWEGYFEEDISLRSTLVDIGLFYTCYGNSPISLSFPFVKWLKCEKCRAEEKATLATYKFRSCKFHLTCKKCKHEGPAEVRDQFLAVTKGARLILWNPEDIDVQYNELTGETVYYYTLPTHLKNAIRVGRREVVDRSPQIYIDAVREKKVVVLDPDNVYHLRRPSILTGRLNRGWGTPLLLPVLKDTFYLQLMKKAQEAVLLERMLPLNVISPAQSVPGVNPYEATDLSQWREHVMQEIIKWRRDPLYIPVMPLALNHQTIGGDGRALLLNNEMRQISDVIMAGIGCPPELVWGGLSWSGSNVSLRILENQFLRYLAGLLRFVQSFVIRRTAAHLGWPEIDVRFKAFKMADDLQRKAFIFQANQVKLVSDTTMRQEMDLNPEEEDELLKSEVKRRLESVEHQQLAEAQIAGKAAVVQAKYQAQAQMALAEEQRQMQEGTYGSAQGEPGADIQRPPVQPAQPGGPQGGFAQMVGRLQQMSPDGQKAVLARIGAQNQELASALQQQLQPQQAAQGGSDGKPLPEQLPPRRANSPI